MNVAVRIPDFASSIVEHARKDFPLLDASMSVAQALDRIRREGVGERVIYFFATDADGRLVGVLPTRRLLTAPLETRLEEIMVSSFKDVVGFADKHKVNNRMASYMLAIDRVASTIKLRGIYA